MIAYLKRSTFIGKIYRPLIVPSHKCRKTCDAEFFDDFAFFDATTY